MNLENFIESQRRDLSEKGLSNPEFLELYIGVENLKLRDILASLHYQLIKAFKSMNDRLPSGEHGAHFWAEPSRDLIFAIETTKTINRALKNSTHAFEIDSYYFNLFESCEKFLKKSGGSSLPPNMEKVLLYYTEPIFLSVSTHKLKRSNGLYAPQLKLIGEGSYATIYSYCDPIYNKNFAIKRAKKNLSAKERLRFRREFEAMRDLSSPYILEVYSYDEERVEYTMEYMDFTLDSYFKKNNSSISLGTRKSIALQILRAFTYLHSKKLIHRDISPNNILIRQYEDVLVVKISDFGLVKTPSSVLTSMNTEFKGSFNDPALMTEGFDSYRLVHETYALTKLLYFVMTGKTNTTSISDQRARDFVLKGLNPDTDKRYQNVDEIAEAFKTNFKLSE